MQVKHLLLNSFSKHCYLTLVVFFILGATYAQPPGNRSLYFDGVDDHVVVSHDPVFDIDTEVTYEAWVKLDSDFGGGIVLRKIQGNTEDKFVSINSDRIVQFYLWSGGPGSIVGINSTNQIPINQWTHIACTFEEGVVGKIYINGIEDVSEDLSTPPILNPRNGSSANLYIGSLAGTQSFFNGQLDEVKIFNTARTITEVQSDMSSTDTNTIGLVAYWNFEDDAAADNQTVAEDVTTNTNDGALTNSPLWAYQVTNTNNTGAGSLRQAITESNTDTDKDYIDFSIAGGGVQTIAPSSALPDISESVIINGYTQPGSSANTLNIGNDAVLNIQLDGGSAGSSGNGLNISASNSEVYGLIIHGFNGGANGIRVTGSENIIAGCQIGLDAFGNSSLNSHGVRVIVSNNTIGLPTPAGRNTISGNRFNGIVLGVSGTTVNNITIQNNYCGTSPDGLSPIGGGRIRLTGSNSCFIGGAGALEGNVAGSGISISGIASGGNQILGNYIGVGADGTTALGSSGSGISFQSDNLNNMIIGGIAAGEANIIANKDNGILLTTGTASTGNSIRGNMMYGNTIGIDLSTAGADTNDMDDADTGNNNLQNFPLIHSAQTISAGNLTIDFSVDATATNSAYGTTGLRIDFYQSDGNRQGEEYLGTINYPAASAQSSFTGLVPLGAIVVGDVIVATATDDNGNTSEFSEDFVVNNLPTAANNTLVINEDEVLTIITGDFNYNDADLNPFTLVTITSIPAQGTLYVDADNDDTFDAGEALAVNDQVLVADLNAGNLQFTGPANESGTPFASVGFNVNDGLGNSSPDNTITIDVIAVNDAPSVDTNTGLTLNKGSIGTIGTSQLSSSDFDNSALELTYTMTTNPISGRLSFSSFTQQDIIDGNVTYTHDDSESFSDTFSFTVSDGTNTTASQAFNIEIESMKEQLDVYVGEGTTGVSIFNNQVEDIDIGQTLVNVEKPETFTIVNSGDTDLIINDISLSDPAFEVRGAPSLIGVGKSANFMVVLLSSIAGTFNTHVTVNSSTQQFTFNVTGEVIDTGEEELPDLEVLNAVTPNGDGIHDFLRIENIELYPDNQMQVFSRFGQIVFDIRGYDNDQIVFEGRSNLGNRRTLNNGTYYYLIDDGVNKKKHTGFFVLAK